ncbi:MAG: nitrophenyl compound nitroreductase subunit ArsF family protein [Bacteroidales bacterium]
MKVKVMMAMIAIFAASVFPVSAQTGNPKNADQNISGDKVEVYYFHYSRRCATCQAVEDQSKKALEELYPEKVKSGDYVFIELSIEDETNATLMEKLNVQGQSLLVVKGDNQKNLTNVAFMNARSKPDKLKEEIKKAVESL